MTSDLQSLFANLAEKERFKGHHSPEGRAIRTLSRALNGLSSGDLSRRDMIVLCDQAVEDWLKARCKLSPWSSYGLPELLAKALEAEWITQPDAVSLQRIHDARCSDHAAPADIPPQEAESALEFCIGLIERHW